MITLQRSNTYDINFAKSEDNYETDREGRPITNALLKVGERDGGSGKQRHDVIKPLDLLDFLE